MNIDQNKKAPNHEDSGHWCVRTDGFSCVFAVVLWRGTKYEQG